MRVGEVFRYARPYSADKREVDDLPNYFHCTHTPGAKLPLLESGINRIKKIDLDVGDRCPAILISSSPHKLGSTETPWQDFFDPDNGHIRYFGDNKDPGADPASSPGNEALLQQFELQTSPEKSVRSSACPIVFFRRVRVGSRAKGNVQFQGFGIISRAERITQFDRKHQRPFTNYVFDFTVLSLTAEHELFDWSWISSRRNPDLSDQDCLKKAPSSWKLWVRGGSRAVETCRRRVAKLLTYSTAEQKPSEGSSQEKVLKEIYDFYSGRKARFESLAALVAARIIQSGGQRYRAGWITPPSSDHGADFVGRLDVGTDLAQAKVIVLGEGPIDVVDT